MMGCEKNLLRCPSYLYIAVSATYQPESTLHGRSSRFYLGEDERTKQSRRQKTTIGGYEISENWLA